jgi:hypothetical protein
MYPPSHSTPGGCFIGVTALFPASYGALSAYGLVKWMLLPAKLRHVDTRFWFLLGSTLLGLLLTVGIIYLAIRVLRTTDFRGYDSKKPGQPSLKW